MKRCARFLRYPEDKRASALGPRICNATPGRGMESKGSGLTPPFGDRTSWESDTSRKIRTGQARDDARPKIPHAVLQTRDRGNDGRGLRENAEVAR